MTDTFGVELRRWRELAGLSLAELAERVHYSKGHLSNVESGRKRPTIGLVQRCDTALEAGGHLIGLFPTETRSARVGRASKPAQLPATVGYFVGRTGAIETLNSALNAASAGPRRVIAIDGSPGVGKSALAIHWAHDRVERFPDGVLYADLREGVSLRNVGPGDALEQFLRAMGVPDHAVPDDFTTRAALYRSMLDGRRMLIMLDNVDTSEQVRPLLPGSTGCVVVATSRTRLSGLVVREGAIRLTMQPLHPDEAGSLLRNLLGDDRIDAERDAAALVAERCAYLPLAIRIAAERAAHPAISLAELANDLADDSTRLDVLTVDDDPSSALRTIVSWSYDALPPTSALMFRLISAHPGQDITAPAAAALVDTTREGAARTLEHLASVSLVDEHTPGRYRLSPLLHVYAAERLVTDDPQVARLHALDRVLTWYLHTAAAAARVIGPHHRHLPLARPTWLAKPPPFSDLLGALSWCDTELQNLVVTIAAAADEGFDAIAWQLPLTLGIYFDLRKPWQTWIDTHHMGLSAARRQENPVAEAWLLTNLAAAYRDVERIDEAQDLLEESLAIQRETGDQRGEARTLIELGQTLAAQGQLDQALGRFRAALQLLPQTGDQHGEAMALLGVTKVYCAADQHAHAQEPIEVALAIFRRLHDRRGEAAALHDLGVTAHGLGYLYEAVAKLEQALHAWRDADDLSGQARTLVRRGHILLDLGNPAAAGASWREALAIFEQLDDPVASTVRAQLQDLGPVVTLPDDKAG